MIGTIIFLIFYFYWTRSSKREAKKLKTVIKYPSDQTIEILKFPKGVDEAAVENFFGQFGLVREVAAVRNYEEMISLSKEAYENSLEIKEHRLINIAKGEEEDEKFVAKMERKNDKILKKLEQI